jgi:hypothetical protein
MNTTHKLRAKFITNKIMTGKSRKFKKREKFKLNKFGKMYFLEHVTLKFQRHSLRHITGYDINKATKEISNATLVSNATMISKISCNSVMQGHVCNSKIQSNFEIM